MAQPPTGADAGKFAAARRAIDLVDRGMAVGLGTGSTAAWMVRALAARAAAERLDLTCVPTSRRTGELAARLGLRVVGLDDVPRLDLTIDGADEFDGAFRLIKGGGAAHLLEKIVAAASDRLGVITDPTKAVDVLGAFPLPVEVTPFGHGATGRSIAAVLAGADVGGREVVLRERDGTPVVTDEGNLIYDLHLQRIGDPESLMCALTCVPGVVETGLFLGMCDTVIIGHPDGRAETRTRDGGTDWMDVDMAAAMGLPA
jgi:ribose 5-phosphate isomerase A